jgi:hypothetical protein
VIRRLNDWNARRVEQREWRKRQWLRAQKRDRDPDWTRDPPVEVVTDEDAWSVRLEVGKWQDRVREAVRNRQTVAIASTRIKTRFHEH